ncbi:putative mediator of RNA polymerase II transcription subunit 29, partial [Piliocolobus tephrosceles]|uniref:putative mediator of RNA polymerase II transcription subunit 29 n=1 Tax=Piliocolobus tephrosceles TaxID=591936 RepID=UPI000E6B15B2
MNATVEESTMQVQTQINNDNILHNNTSSLDKENITSENMYNANNDNVSNMEGKDKNIDEGEKGDNVPASDMNNYNNSNGKDENTNNPTENTANKSSDRWADMCDDMEDIPLVDEYSNETETNTQFMGTSYYNNDMNNNMKQNYYNPNKNGT